MDSIVQLFKEMSPLRLSLIIGGFLILLISIIFFSFRSNNYNLVPLYSNLDLKDSSKIVTELESKNIEFQIRANGSEILVPQDQVLRLRMSMAQAGIPSKGSLVGYEIFDTSEAFGTSSFVQNVNLLRALEGELARTINSFTNINNTRVHLVIPKRELFSRERQIPSASVILELKGVNSITKEQVNAISNLVATAVPNLEVNKITIVDTAGRSLKLGAKGDDDPAVGISNSEEYRVAYENRLKNIIEELLEQSIGIGHVKAQVSAEINFDRIVTNYEIYDPDGQVVRSIQESSDKENSIDKDQNSNVSITSNLPSSTTNGGTQSSSNNERNDTTTNYEISKTIKNQISESGTIKRLSIAILIDGTYKVDKKTKEITYIPRDEAELRKYESLVKSAVGFDSERKDKIELVNMQFISDLDSNSNNDSPIEWLKKDLPNIIQTLVIGIIVILILLLVIRPIAIRAFEATKSDIDEAAAIEKTQAIMSDQGLNIEQLQDEQNELIGAASIETKLKSNNTYKAVNEIVIKYPQETLTTLRRWMNKE